MLFPTFAFGLFFVVVFVVNWLTRPAPRLWKPLMLGFSFFFYGYWNWRFVLLLAFTISVNWIVGNAISELRAGGRAAAARWWVRIGVVVNLGVLGVFKYYDFFAVELANLLDRVGIGGSLPVLELTLPVGISFFTFQAMSYIIDLGRGDVEPMKPLDFAVYLSFFPQLVAGPIVRASEMAPQLAAQPDPRYVPSAEAFRLILAGLFKKVVVSSFLASEIVDPVFANPGAHSSPEVLVGVYAYAIQIYADFSGYTDIAIGVALLLGFRFPLNFDAPYRALSLRDFWRRWHMTLSRWLRDYLYVPLGGNRLGKLLTYRNLMLTMLLGGLWHGSTWTFVIWGGIHGVVLAAERFVRERRAERGTRDVLPPVWGAAVRWFVTFHVVCLAWVFFRAEGLGRAFDVLGRVAAFDLGGGAGVLSPLVALTVVLALASQFVPAGWLAQFDEALTDRGWLVQGVVIACSLVAIDALGPDGVSPFIYFQF
ncbi:MAG TPA: acyltransferase [Acidimicrobiaceae bacterium]|nr:acyltransferase [Acidimicrobiaceae bacterium]HCB37036.1 acyltransferase [Acidimicrobiaceae bacterium]